MSAVKLDLVYSECESWRRAVGELQESSKGSCTSLG